MPTKGKAKGEPKTKAQTVKTPPVWSRKNASSIFAGLDGERFEHLLFALLGAECRLCCLAIPDFHFDYATNKGDGGVDATIRKAPPIPSRWVTQGIIQAKLSCPSKSALEKELQKQRVVEALQQGRAYTLVTAAEMEPDAEDRLSRLIRGVHPSWQGPARVIGASQLVALLREYPSAWALMPESLRPYRHIFGFEEWEARLRKSDQRDLVRFVPTAERKALFGRIDSLSSSADRHLHIEGAPGVGKTRCALEAFRDRPEVVAYCDRFSDSLLDLPREPGRSLYGYLVVDECSEDQRSRLESYFGNSDLRLITIGAEVPSIWVRPGPNTHRLEVLRGDELEEVARLLGAELSESERRAATQKSGGYPKLLRILFTAREKYPTDRDLNAALLRYLTEDEQREDAFIALSLPRTFSEQQFAELTRVFEGCTLNDLRKAQRRLSDSGLLGDIDDRTRYVTPLLLGEMLASRYFWDNPRGAFERLRTANLTPELLESCLLRLVQMQGGAERLARIDPATLEQAVSPSRLPRLLAAMSPYAPEETLAALRRLLPRLTNPADSLFVLCSAAWFESTFDESIDILASFSEARAEVPSFFGAFLGPTRARAAQRLRVIQRLSESPDEAMRLLGVDCAAAACEQESGRVVAWRSPEPIEHAWRPTNLGEEQSYRTAAAEILGKALQDSSNAVRAHASTPSTRAVRGLVRSRMAGAAAALIEAWAASEFPTAPLVAVLNTIEAHDREYLAASGAEARDRYLRAVAALKPRSIGDKLSVVAKPASWGDPDLGEIDRVASEAMQEPSLGPVAAWCFSEDAVVAVEIGRALAKYDHSQRLLPLLLDHARSQPRLRTAASYCAELPDIDDRLGNWATAPSLARFVLEVCWLLKPTQKRVEFLRSIVEIGALEAGRIEQLLFGGWLLRAPPQAARECIVAIAVREPVAAFRLAFQAFEKSDPAFVKERWWQVPLESLGRTQLTWEWSQVARDVGSQHPIDVARHLATALRERTDVTTEVRAVLNRLLIDGPAEVGLIVLELLEGRPELASGGLLSGLASPTHREAILSWATDVQRARIVVRARSTIDEVVMTLLDRFRIEDTVSAILHSRTGVGNDSDRLETLKQTLETSLAGSHSRAFERWARRELRFIESELKRARQAEQAYGLGVIDLPFVAEGPH
jgi:hypothetical protein